MEVFLWDVTGQLINQFQLPVTAGGDWINAVDMSPDGQWLAAATETGAYLASITGNTMAHLPHPVGGRLLQFSPDSQHLITLSTQSDGTDGTARVWRVETPAALLVRSCQWVTPYLQSLSSQNPRAQDLNIQDVSAQDLDSALGTLDLCRNITG